MGAIVAGGPSATTIPKPMPSRYKGGPQLHPIKALHRHDGYISFALKEGDNFQPTFAIKATSLESLFPGYVERLTRNSYVGINAAYTLASGNWGKDAGRPRHRNDTLKYLCACYCDIDHYKANFSFNQVHSRVMDMCEAGTLPWASMVVNSGRGMWLLWLLHDPNGPTQAHLGAWNEGELDPLQVYSRINRAIIERLARFGTDQGCSDGARYIRVPGSFSNVAEKFVWWSVQGEGDAGFSYTLWELADLLGVKCRRMLPVEREAICPRRKIPGRQSGQIAANKNRLCAVRTLMDLRGGGFQKGHRGKGAWIYAMCLYRRRVDRREAMESVREFGKECKPPLLQAECDSQTCSGYKPTQRRWPYRKIASVLGVTLGEAEIISQRIGKPFPSADGMLIETTRLSGKPKQGECLNLRRSEIMRIIREEECILPLRQMEAKLRERGHEAASYVSVRTDYKALGYETPRTARFRFNADARSAQGVLSAL